MTEKDVQLLIRGIVKPTKQYIADQLAPLLKRLDALEARQGKAMIYRGTYDPTIDYAVGDTVTDHGSIWHCNVPSRAVRPGSSSAWTLCVKAGRDGKDLRP